MYQKSKTTRTISVRVPNEVADAIREAAKEDKVTVSSWALRRLRNNLRRTGRLQSPETRQYSPE